jgi:hypothetical protein
MGVGAGSRRTPCLCVTVLRSSILSLEVVQFSAWRSLGVLFGELCVGLGSAVCQGKRVQRIHMHHPLIQHASAVVCGNWRRRCVFLIISLIVSPSPFSRHPRIGYVPASSASSDLTGRRSVFTITVCPIFPVYVLVEHDVD